MHFTTTRERERERERAVTRCTKEEASTYSTFK
jgi:hypothetical protein